MASSEATEGTRFEQHGPTNGQKLKVTIELDGRATGDNAAKWNSRMGHYVRMKVPISFADFRRVKDNHRIDVWNGLMSEFELSMHPNLARPLVESFYSQKFRTFKDSLRRQYLDGKTMEECLVCPKGFDPIHWTPFVRNELAQKQMEKKETNKINKSKDEDKHAMGRRSYAQLHYLEKQKNPEVKRSRVDDWKKGRVRADGSILESACGKYVLVEATEERLASSNISEEGSNSQVDINSDALSEVFGLDHRNRIRVVGSSITKKQYHRTAAAKAILEEVNNVSVAEVKSDVANVKTDVAGVKTDMASLKSMMETMLQHVVSLAGGKFQPSPMMALLVLKLAQILSVEIPLPLKTWLKCLIQ